MNRYGVPPDLRTLCVCGHDQRVHVHDVCSGVSIESERSPILPCPCLSYTHADLPHRREP